MVPELPRSSAPPLAVAELSTKVQLAITGVDSDAVATAPEQVFTTAFLEAADSSFADLDDTWSCLVRANSIVHQPLEPLSFPPTLIMLAGDDDLVDTPLQREAFDSLCARGLPLQYLECEGVTHTQGALASLPEQLAFLKARWEGQPWPEADRCVRTSPVTCSGEVDLP